MSFMSKKRKLINELDSDVKKSQKEALEDLLQKSRGYPKQNSDILRKFNDSIEHQETETACGGVYWAKVSEDWLKKQNWYALLWCEPHKNALAPGAPKRFSIQYSNPLKPGWIGLPRFLGISVFGPPKKDIRSLGSSLNENVLWNTEKGELRDYQNIGREKSILSLQEWGGATIIADCGAGKTALAISIALSLKRKTLIVCNRVFLMNQWKEEILGNQKWCWEKNPKKKTKEIIECPEFFEQYLICQGCQKSLLYSQQQPSTTMCGFCNHRHTNGWIQNKAPSKGWLTENVRVGWIQGNKIQIKDCDFVVASIESISRCNYDANLLKEFGTVIIDEMHHLGALSLSQVLPKLPARYILGVTATPDRNDGLEHILYWLAGPTSFVYKRLPHITGFSKSVNVRRVLFSNGEKKEIFYYGGSQLAFASMISELSRDQIRNDMIVHLAKNAIAEGARKKILIVTSIVEHAKMLAEKIGAFAIHGGVQDTVISRAKSAEARALVATYQFMEEGYDDPFIDTIIMALPRSKIQQVVGRCERTHAGKLTPLIIDIVDTFSVFEGMSKKRNKFYKSRGFNLETIQIK